MIKTIGWGPMAKHNAYNYIKSSHYKLVHMDTMDEKE